MRNLSIDVDARSNAFVTEEESGSYSHHFDTGLAIELIGDIDVNMSCVWDHAPDPRPLEDGSVPKKDETRQIFGLGRSF